MCGLTDWGKIKRTAGSFTINAVALPRLGSARLGSARLGSARLGNSPSKQRISEALRFNLTITASRDSIQMELNLYKVINSG